MSPHCYPPKPEFGLGRTAERQVWEVLRDQLPGDAALLYSVAMIEGPPSTRPTSSWPGPASA
jgi:hypothetical protein